MHVVGLSLSPNFLTALAVLVSTGVWLVRTKKEIRSRNLETVASKRRAIIEQARAEQVLNDALRERAAHLVVNLCDDHRATIVELLKSDPKGAVCFAPDRLLDYDADQIQKVVRPIIEKSGFVVRSLEGTRAWWRPGFSIVVKDRNQPPPHAARMVRAFREVGIELLVEDDWRLGDDVLLWIGGHEDAKGSLH